MNTSLYESNDIDRWVELNTKKRTLLVERLGKSPFLSTDIGGIDFLSLTCLSEAYTAFALGDHNTTKSKLIEAVKLEMRILELGRGGNREARESTESGLFPHLLHALAAHEWDLAIDFANLFEIHPWVEAQSTDESNFIAKPLRALILGDTEGALRHLLDPLPRERDPQFKGYIECVTTLANMDLEGFARELDIMKRNWQRYMKRHFSGMPSSVCFFEAQGFEYLAEILNA